MSGVDLPIKGQKYIHEFCDRYPNKEFLGVTDIIDSRTKRLVLFPKYQRTERTSKASRISFVLRCLNYPFDLLQRYLNYPFKMNNGIMYKMGPNWCSLTHNAVGLLILHKDEFVKPMKRRGYTDEMWKQTIIFNELGIACLYDSSDTYQSCMRLIDWKRGNPYSFTVKDIGEIKKSEKLFCRKITDVRLAEMLKKMFKSCCCEKKSFFY